MGFSAMFTWTTLRGKHCWHPRIWQRYSCGGAGRTCMASYKYVIWRRSQQTWPWTFAEFGCRQILSRRCKNLYNIWDINTNKAPVYGTGNVIYRSPKNIIIQRGALPISRREQLPTCIHWTKSTQNASMFDWCCQKLGPNKHLFEISSHMKCKIHENAPKRCGRAFENCVAATVYSRCGRVVTDFDWEAKNRFNF